MEKNIKANPPSPSVDGFERIHISPTIYMTDSDNVLERGSFYTNDITNELKHVTDIQKKFIQSFCSVFTEKLVEVFPHCIKITMTPTNDSTVIVNNFNIKGSNENYSFMMVFVNNKLDIFDYMLNDTIITYLCNRIKRILEFETPQDVGCY